MTSRSPRHRSSGAPKKARWSSARKAEAKAAGRGRDATRERTRPRDGARSNSERDEPTSTRTVPLRDDQGRRTGSRAGQPYAEQSRSEPRYADRTRPERSYAERRRADATHLDRTGGGPDRARAKKYADEKPKVDTSRAEKSRVERPRVDRARVEKVRRNELPVHDEVPVDASNGFAALGLSDVLVRRLARDGIASPFPIQEATIPDALSGRDVLGRGQTGSGKTLAFGLPVLTRLATGTPARGHRPRALVLVPTRELAIQVSDALEPLAHVMSVRHKLVAGGLAYASQIAALSRGVDLLIATPGRLIDLMDRGVVELGDVEVVVLDEADHMADMGFLPDVTTILDQVPDGGQRLLFSATLDNGVDAIVERYLSDPVEHATDAPTASVATMDHHVLLVEPKHKKVITGDVANRDGRTVVFVRTKLGADRTALQLREQGVFAAALHGGLNQGARNRVLAAFRDGRLPVLVATDVAARGIHVDDVSVVLQVDPPADHKDYLHRAGRTARAGERGTVITLALPHQRRTVERLTRDAGVEVTPVAVVPGDDALLAATGARRTSGVPIPEEAYRRLVDPPKRGRPRGGAPRGGGRPGGPRAGGSRSGGPRGAGRQRTDERR